MAKPIQPFLEWEAKLTIDYLGNDMALPADALMEYQIAVTGQLPLTINQIRKKFGWKPHPDSRGAMYVWQDDVPNPDPTIDDRVIPPAVLKDAWATIQAREAEIIQGGRSPDALAAAYPLLSAAAQAA